MARDTLRIFTSTLYGKTNTNPTLTLTDTGGAVLSPDPNAMIQKKEERKKTAILKPKNTKLR